MRYTRVTLTALALVALAASIQSQELGPFGPLKSRVGFRGFDEVPWVAPWNFDGEVGVQPTSLLIDPATNRMTFASELLGLAGQIDLSTIDFSGKGTFLFFNGVDAPGTSVELLAPRLLIPAPCPGGGLNCFVATGHDNCSILLIDGSGRVDLLGGGECVSNGNPEGKKLRDIRVPKIGGIGILDDNSMVFSSCGGTDYRLIRLASDWTGEEAEVVAGTGAQGFAPDGTLAVNGPISCVTGIIQNDTIVPGPRAAHGRSAPQATGGMVFADTGNHRIRRISASGVITTVAGSNASAAGPNGDGGPATSARLRRPECVSGGLNGAFYICDTGQDRIRRVDASGIITTVAGTGTFGVGVPGQLATATPLWQPISVAQDNAGNLWIAENARVSSVRAGTGIYQVAFGSKTPGQSNPFYNGDNLAGRFTSLSNIGDVAAVVGAADGGPAVEGTSATLLEVLIPDYGTNRIRRYDPASDLVTTIAGTGLTPTSSDPSNGDGGPALNAKVVGPYGVAVTPDNRIVFTELAGCRVREINRATGIITTIAGTGQCTLFNNPDGDGGPATAATLGQPMGIVVDPAGNLYWTEQSGSKVRMLTKATGNISTVAGTGTPGDSGDNGPATAAQLRVPFDLDYDAVGQRLIVSDTFNHRIRAVNLALNPPTITTIVGMAGFGFSGDGGPPTAALLNTPYSVAVIGNELFVSDTNNHRLRRVSPLAGGTPIITTVAGTGTPGQKGQGSGNALAARLFGPSGIAAGPDGRVIVAEYFGRRIGMLEPAAAPPVGPPGQPGPFTAVVNGNLVTFNWAPPTTGAPPTIYTMLVRVVPGGPVAVTLPIDGALNSLTLTAPNGTFYLTLTASNAAGTGPESAVLTLLVPQIPAPPGPPALAATVVGSTVTFNWSPPATGGPVASYILAAAFSPGGPIQISTPPIQAYTDAPPDRPAAAVTSYRVTDVPVNTYYVKLLARNAGGDSPFSNEVTVTVLPPAVPLPPALATSVLGRTVTLTWVPAATGPAPTSYLIEAFLPGETVPFLSSPYPTTTIVVPNVPSNTYRVQVRAANGAGVSAPSNLATVVVN